MGSGKKHQNLLPSFKSSSNTNPKKNVSTLPSRIVIIPSQALQFIKHSCMHHCIMLISPCRIIVNGSILQRGEMELREASLISCSSSHGTDRPLEPGHLATRLSWGSWFFAILWRHIGEHCEMEDLYSEYDCGLYSALDWPLPQAPWAPEPWWTPFSVFVSNDCQVGRWDKSHHLLYTINSTYTY